jgi:hypothetical protein
MTRFLISTLAVVSAVTGCVDKPRQAREDCHLESGWLDSTDGCSERNGYADCWKACADGTRTRLGSGANPQASPH